MARKRYKNTERDFQQQKQLSNELQTKLRQLNAECRREKEVANSDMIAIKSACYKEVKEARLQLEEAKEAMHRMRIPSPMRSPSPGLMTETTPSTVAAGTDLKPGQCVCFKDLDRQMPQMLNTSYGKLRRFSTTTGRWVVETPTGMEVHMWPDSLALDIGSTSSSTSESESEHGEI